jgi:hypothetical protein
MTYDIATIRTNIKTLLQTVTQFSFVYDYLNPNIEGYPAIVFDMTNNESEMLTDTENLRTITFTVYLLTEIGVKGQQGAIDILDVATNNAITALEKITNMSLSGSVDWIMPTVGPREQIAGPNGALFSQRLDINAKISTSIL